jgi:cystathionine beta-synthase
MVSTDGMEFHENILGTVGETPLVRLRAVARDVPGLLLAKVESRNPGGSVKDRIGIKILEEAERRGEIKPGATVVEATSGNTGVGLAIAAAVKGYKAILTMPDKMSQEKISLIKAYGAQVIVTPTAVPPDSPESNYEVAKRIARETPNAFLANQYFNPDNPQAHYETTGPEIWRQTAGRVTHIVAGIGTGGTISGIARFLKEKNPKIRAVGADPAGSIIKGYYDTGKIGEAKSYLVEGIGEDIIPGTCHFQYLDEIITVTDRPALNMARRVSREEGILCGGSSGTAVVAALQVAGDAGPDAVVVVILPDTGERYLSKVHNDAWMRDNRILDVSSYTVGDLLGSKPRSLPRLLDVPSTEKVREALKLVREYEVSQLPVREKDRHVGTLSEARVLSAVLEDPALLEAAVTAVMDPPLAEVTVSTTFTELRALLARRDSAVLVLDGDRHIGILTRHDLIEYLVP